MDLSVIIVNWNTKQLLIECLNSLAPATVKCRMEVIVVDNASTDGSPEMVLAMYPWIKLMRNSENLGFARANNVLAASG